MPSVNNNDHPASHRSFSSHYSLFRVCSVVCVAHMLGEVSPNFLLPGVLSITFRPLQQEVVLSDLFSPRSMSSWLCSIILPVGIFLGLNAIIEVRARSPPLVRKEHHFVTIGQWERNPPIRHIISLLNVRSLCLTERSGRLPPFFIWNFLSTLDPEVSLIRQCSICTTQDVVWRQGRLSWDFDSSYSFLFISVLLCRITVLECTRCSKVISRALRFHYHY